MSDKILSAFTKEEVKEDLLKTIFVSLVTSLTVAGVLYYLRLQHVDGFITKYGYPLLLSIASYAIVLPSIRHVRAYKEFPCMSGMMVGMTIGMIAGFLPGFYAGSTNGMFWGSVLGMSIGIFFGVTTGRCCGIMGKLEGAMAGFMGGLMGAMTAVMLLNDNLIVMAVIALVACAGIVFGLNLMIYGESRQLERKQREDHSYTIVWSFVLTVVTIWLMVFGPRSPLFQ
ncbi:hypothetical protein FJZ18_01305 [Candidatus Pacearchaeota archaeon]|nr:hypothetical protein [Candidatus Pacearchaeota archaeon]